MVAASGLASWIAFTGSIQAAPLKHALRPGLQATRAPFSAFPAELTMLNDLSVFDEAWRKKQPVGDVGGLGRPADPTAYFLLQLLSLARVTTSGGAGRGARSAAAISMLPGW